MSAHQKAMMLFGIPAAGIAARLNTELVGAVKEAQPFEET